MGAQRPEAGWVRLLAKEPGKEERYAHAAGLLAVIARGEAAKPKPAHPLRSEQPSR